ncbi:hypothetical protein AN958_06103 [Leucoagaricus sp. SymC.cos]|nr:hypothetical protein AN958_06103 [Leucoagaricus sp. SymC.cos]
MIALTSTSYCDICLEYFGQDPAKSPCSLLCGHVFCLVCLPNVSGHICPLCRTPYQPSDVVKLHLDVDGTSRGSPSSPPLSATQAEQEAKRFHSLFAEVANNGSSEGKLRSIIDDCRKFLVSQPRSLFSELRITHRMFAYLCEVKANLLSSQQKGDELNVQVGQLRAEKEELERRIQEVKDVRREERKRAHDVERTLRDHCSRAHEAYETVVDQYNFVLQEWMRLQQEVKLMRMPPTPQPEPATPDMEQDPDLAKTPQPRFVSELDQSKLKDVVTQDPLSLLISPLPQFTGRLPEAILPDEDEPQETTTRVKPASKPSRQEQSQIAFQPFEVPSTPSFKKCDAAGHPYTCNCVEFAIFSDAPKSESRRPPLTSTVSTPIMETKLKSPLSTPSVVASTPLMSPGRNRSHTIPSHGSRPPSRAPSPKPRTNGSIGDVQNPTPNHSSHQSRKPESLKSRLHDLLQDNAPMSSSLPNMSSSHFPSSLTQESPRQTSTAKVSHPSSHPGNTPPQHRVNPVLSPAQGDNVRVSPPTSPAFIPPSTPSAPTTTPTPVISRASNAAQIIEKEREDRERRRREKEKKRLNEQESLGRSNSVSSTTSASRVSSTNYARSHTHSSRDSNGSYAPSQRHTTSSHSSAPIPVPSPRIYT